MKKRVLGSLALSLLSTAAFAADLPSRRALPVYAPPPMPVFTWTGIYAGVNAGYEFNGDATFLNTGNTPAQIADIGVTRPGFVRDRSSGFTGGAQIGYNYQFSAGSAPGTGFVIGVEADAAYAGPGSGSIIRTTVVSGFNSKTDYVGTVRGRLGYAFDKFLVYGTGGFAYGNVRDTVALYNLAGTNTFLGGYNAMRAGYAYGGGVEYAIATDNFLNFFHSSAVTVKAEFIRYDLGTSTILVGSTLGTGNSYSSRIHTTGNIIRAGLNYKLDLFGAPAPVVARY